MITPNCKFPVPHNSWRLLGYKFCPHCGQELNKEVNSKVPNQEEIHRAHDILECILTSGKIELTKENIVIMYASLTTLCWILGHDRGNQFIENMVTTEEELSRQGIIFVKKDSDDHPFIPHGGDSSI